MGTVQVREVIRGSHQRDPAQLGCTPEGPSARHESRVAVAQH
ncbi:hypothetical protein [Streptomyces scopuliridis]|uniref:Uncharacterized protein n=1 Tax=Streptomyces scopuliridis RB72 TaxID=1440053 RepID=A0A2T7T4I7_9ACTN|nr:hypothetical protein [Streptomyces scopuliridis]PVE10032.1 hypothetical protein Y717_15855 [Streptomyces scopuliridis RB72]